MCLKAPKVRSARLRQMSVYPSFNISNGDNLKYVHRHREMVQSAFALRRTPARWTLLKAGQIGRARRSPMSAMGQKQTFRALAIYVRFRGQSGRAGLPLTMSAYSHKRTSSRRRFSNPDLRGVRERGNWPRGLRRVLYWALRKHLSNNKQPFARAMYHFSQGPVY